MKREQRAVWAIALVCCLLLCSCDMGGVDPGPGEGTDQTDPTEVTMGVPTNILQIGESFDYYPDYAQGRFTCKVTDVRVVEEQSQCPPKDEFFLDLLPVYIDGKCTPLSYEDWFTEGGAFDLGARVILVDLTVTNVDAVAYLYDGTLYHHPTQGLYLDPCVFDALSIVAMTDMTECERGHFKGALSTLHYSLTGMCGEEDLDTFGIEHAAIRIEPGETLSFTVGFGVGGFPGGVRADLSKYWIRIGADNTVDNGRFIELHLGA